MRKSSMCFWESRNTDTAVRMESWKSILPRINPGVYTAESLSDFLGKWFSGYVRGRKNAKTIFKGMDAFVIGEASVEKSPFAGIKLYPPMGFDPWPDDEAEREKVEILYSFCEKKKIPIITHCDDGGFRVLSLENSWRQTSPSRYRPALEKYPGLMIDFAHLGNQYSMPLRMTPVTEWRDQIFSLMAEYPASMPIYRSTVSCPNTTQRCSLRSRPCLPTSARLRKPGSCSVPTSW